MMEKPNPLQNTTILRFAHAFESGGGTERYLDDLDQALLERNELTVVRLHLTRNPKPQPPSEEKIGKGLLVRIALPIRPDNTPGTSSDVHSPGLKFKQRLRDALLYNPLVWNTIGAGWVSRRPLQPEPGQAIGAGAVTASVFKRQRIDLAMLHFFGGADAEEVILEAKRAGVPVALLNHYANDRFLHLAIRKHTSFASKVAGVNGRDVPAYLQGRFTNLADGVDINFFSRAEARPVVTNLTAPCILLPARIVPEKGQLDLVRAIAELKRTGVPCNLAFAGRADGSAFVDELRAEIARSGLSDSVHFLGSLDLPELRDWYAASAIVALPTYHHEGLPRIILEAQAMSTPVIAYATGGVADGICDGVTGYLLKTGDQEGLVTRLRTLLTQPDLKTTMGQNGRQAAEKRFCLAALAERHEEFYKAIISSRVKGVA